MVLSGLWITPKYKTTILFYQCLIGEWMNFAD